MRSLTVTDYGYKYLKKEGYSEEQIGEWVKRTPKEKRKSKSPTANKDANLLREDAKSQTQIANDAKSQTQIANDAKSQMTQNRK